MITDDITINLSPYLGCSKHLIEFFAIIGYEEEVIKSFGYNFMNNQDKLELSFLSINAADISYEINTDYIIKQVYPDKPEIKKNERPPCDSVIFSSCIDSVQGDKKIFYSCYAFRFYEKISLEENYYVPKAFLIYSQYPYFSCFSRICEKIFNCNDNKNYGKEFPVEIFIHCLVNYFPSSLNSELILTDFKPEIIIPRLTGYPHIDFNLPKVINSIGLNEFIKIYILIFLELDLLFFSPNLEKLNIFMFALYILNYPLTDSNYFWHIKTISINDLDQGDDSITTSFKGVNSEIIENLDLSKFKVLNFIIDLENTKEPILSISNNKETTEINTLLSKVDTILTKEKKKTPFSEAIINLKKSIKEILKEYSDNAKVNPKIDESFFYVNEIVFNKSKAIQEIFYNFILNILVELNKDYTFDPTFTFPLIKNINDSPKLQEEEKLFLKFSRNTIKYNSYFQFLSDFKVYDGLKLSLLFSDEFVSLKKKDFYNKMEKEKKISYFEIMDEFFTKKKIKKFDLNDLNEEYSIKHFLSLHKENKSQNLLKFFTLQKDIIKKFVYIKKNKNVYKSLSPPDEVIFEKSTKSSFHFTIQNYFTQRIGLLKVKYYLRGSFQYIIATCIPFFSEKKIPEVIDEYLLNIKKMNYFDRYYIFLILKAINKYRRLNQEKNTFPEMNNINTKKYFQTIQSYLKDNSITQDEIIFNLFKKNSTIQENQNENNGNEFSYVCDDRNFSNNISANLIFEDKIIFRRNGNNIEFNNRTNSQGEIPSIFQESYSYFESCYEENFDIIKIDVLDIAEKIVNLMGFNIKLNIVSNYQKMLDILFYLLNCLMYYRDQVVAFNNQN